MGRKERAPDMRRDGYEGKSWPILQEVGYRRVLLT
jgi:hypothetical protein